MYDRAATVIAGSWQLYVSWEIKGALLTISASRDMRRSAFMNSFSSEVNDDLLTLVTKTKT